ncbi:TRANSMEMBRANE PROTEIN 68 [Salix purpurea]|uniref:TRANSMEMBRANE PROTEIN 68 n=1 Tax=Salix purpurea TaxID=77065 RepID=A0A9Q0VT57_SALPP|nr:TRANSMEMBRANE PROTEIN 68 [Salix purpurea]
MAVNGACFFAGFPTTARCARPASSGKFKPSPSVANATRRFAVSTEESITAETTAGFAENGRLEKKVVEGEKINPYVLELEKTELEYKSSRESMSDYFEESKNFIESNGGGGGGVCGPPRWFSPLDCGSRLDNSPLPLYLPGIDGVGLGLSMHHSTLGKTSEAARNPDNDLVLVLVNPATCFEKSQSQPLTPLLEIMPIQHQFGLPYILSLMTGDPLKMVIDSARKGVPLQEIIGGLSQDAVVIPSNLNVLAALLPRETLLWKLNMLKVASKFANPHLHAVKAQTLVLSSGRDQLLPSEEEGQRLHRVLPKCQNRSYSGSGHFLLLEDVFDLATLIKGSGFYRRGAHLDYVSDYVPPTPLEFKKIYEPNRLFLLAISSVMLSTLRRWEDSEGPCRNPFRGTCFVQRDKDKAQELGQISFLQWRKNEEKEFQFHCVIPF